MSVSRGFRGSEGAIAISPAKSALHQRCGRRRVRLIDTKGVIVDCDAQVMQFGYRRPSLGGRLVIGAVLSCGRRLADVKKRFQDNWRFKRSRNYSQHTSAGCVFKNPEGHSAGQLIDAAGLKGFGRGKARV
ncbi:MAG: hypothetical protein R3E58_01575 [Phycisphaerae bacterium]